MQKYELAPALTDEYVTSVWETLPRHIMPTLLLRGKESYRLFGCEITIATETFQHTGSFKFRAAYNLLSSLPKQQIVTASSGNYGQAVAYACQLLGKTCTIVMPSTSAQVKIDAVESYGGVVDLIDVHTISRNARVEELLDAQPGAFWAHPYDDYRVVAGNSTLGMEILRAADFDIIVAPVGGGGLSSGQVLARDRRASTTEIIGAEPHAGNDAARSLRNGMLLFNESEPDTIADGARTLGLGELNWEILRRGIADIIEVTDETTADALRYYFGSMNLKTEPTGALSLGAILTRPERFQGKRVCCIVSGGNVDPKLFASLVNA